MVALGSGAVPDETSPLQGLVVAGDGGHVGVTDGAVDGQSSGETCRIEGLMAGSNYSHVRFRK